MQINVTNSFRKQKTAENVHFQMTFLWGGHYQKEFYSAQNQFHDKATTFNAWIRIILHYIDCKYINDVYSFNER